MGAQCRYGSSLSFQSSEQLTKHGIEGGKVGGRQRVDESQTERGKIMCKGGVVIKLSQQVS